MSIIQFQGVTKAFGDNTILDGVDLTVEEGQVVVLIGPSGSGKSTLLRCINGLETISGGDLVVDGHSVNGPRATLRQIRREAGMVFQQFNLFPQLTALENVAFGPRKVRGASRSRARVEAAALLRRVGLEGKENHLPRQLSGGQQQRVAIARALAIKPRVMLFDEPTSALDPELRQEVLQVMRSLAAEGMTMVVVTHEMTFAREVGTRLLFIEQGHIIVDADPKTALANPDHPRLRDFLAHVA